LNIIKYLDSVGITHLWDKIKEKFYNKEEVDALLAKASNPNFIINWNWGNPVNELGKTAYSAAGFTINRWKKTTDVGVVNLNDGSILLDNTAGSETMYFVQYCGGDLNGVVTFSVLNENGVSFVSGDIDSGAQVDCTFGSLQFGYTDTENEYFVQIGVAAGHQTAIKAVKLESGAVQTLANTNDYGEWDLTDTSDYAEQFAKCQMYSLYDDAFIGHQRCRPNILRNWDCLYLVNRLGQSSYTEAGTGFDGWTIGASSNATVREDSYGMQLTENSGTGYAFLSQAVSFSLDNGPYTFTVLTTDGLFTETHYLTTSNGAGVRIYSSDGTIVGGLTLFGTKIQEVGPSRMIVTLGAYPGATFVVRAIKIEKGDRQTLAYQEDNGRYVLIEGSNYDQEMAKCVQYELIPSTLSDYCVTNYIGTPTTSNSTFMTKVYLTPSAWDAETNTQTVSVEGILADETKQSIEVSPYNKENTDLVTKYGIYCSAQGDNTLTFTAESIPDSMVVFAVEWKDIAYQKTLFDDVSFTLAENNWATISAISKSGQASSVWNIGDTIPVDIDGASYDFQIIGFDHDDVSDSAAYGRSKAGITFQMVGKTSAYYTMTSSTSVSGGWGSSAMKGTTLPSIKGTMPTELTDVIVTVNKLGYGWSSQPLRTTEDSLFLLSESELTGAYSHSRAGEEGNQYQYYTDNGYTNFSSWLRTVAKSMDGYCSAYNGAISTYSGSASSRAISFAFCV